MDSRSLSRKRFSLLSFLWFGRARQAVGGFSLVEVVVALGIVSFSLVGILSMFPVALDTAKDSKSETRITLIAQNIFSDLRASQSTNAFVMVKQVEKAEDYVDPLYVEASPLLNFPAKYVAYDREGRPLQSITLGDFTNQFNDAKAGFLASVSTNMAPQPGLVRIDVTIVSSPQAGGASTARKSHFFTTYLPTQ